MTIAESVCKMCGECCRFEIPITLLDIHRIVKHLNMLDKEVFDKYIQNRIGLKSFLFMIRKKKEGECVFLADENRCIIHKSKPKICRFFSCKHTPAEDVMPWTASCTSSADKAELWEQSVAVLLTKAYIKKNKATWNNADYDKAIKHIYDNIVMNDKQKIKLARNENGESIFMIYDCSQCENPGTFAKETPVTLDDIRRISRRIGMTMKAFFSEKIASEPSAATGGLKLIRKKRCVFFHVDRHCTIKDIRPMHCRFTPCPAKTTSAEMFDCFFLGSGTVEEQFRHQVALAVTRQYVNEANVKYNKHLVKKLLKTIDDLASNQMELKKFTRKLSSCRYVDDTLMISGHRENICS